MSDLAMLDTAAAANEGAVITLRHPVTDDDLDITVRIVGRDSDRFRDTETAQLRRGFVETSNRATRAKKARKRTDDEMTEDDASEKIEKAAEWQIELLVACTLGWTNVELDGAPLVFSAENAAIVYRRFRWIRDQVDLAIGDRANFTVPPSAASSSSLDTTSVST